MKSLLIGLVLFALTACSTNQNNLTSDLTIENKWCTKHNFNEDAFYAYFGQ